MRAVEHQRVVPPTACCGVLVAASDDVPGLFEFAHHGLDRLAAVGPDGGQMAGCGAPMVGFAEDVDEQAFGSERDAAVVQDLIRDDREVGGDPGLAVDHALPTSQASMTVP